ncbi:hypothetical protein BSU04_06505 [Caballeronia sordidicola]|uniref:Uncharacterized protein n=1 Tax=Caballeronia sordidicola TaxID=196367 RepID=A0A226X9A7_CABSO|nr:hypothetical protein BSU04_06505 [Caballeronia sordidicola]
MNRSKARCFERAFFSKVIDWVFQMGSAAQASWLTLRENEPRHGQ